MKSIISYTVLGSTRDELFEKAEQVYRNLMDDQEVELPSNVVLEISPGVSSYTESGDDLIVQWEASVHISGNYR